MRLFLLSLLLATLGNADVVKLVKAGLSAETIEAKIATSETKFDTSTDALVALAADGVPDRVIRAMIEHDHVAVAPVPPVPPVPSQPPAAPRSISRRYDVTVHAEKGAGKCDAELRVDGKRIKASRCRALDFDLAWSNVEKVCYTYGFRGEVVLATKEHARKISTTTPAEAKRIVDQIRASAPNVTVAECH